MKDAPIDPPILNLNRLSTVLNGEERSELFQLFLESASETLGSLQSLSRESPFDSSAARHELHGFKGACISIGAEKLAYLIKHVESQLLASPNAAKSAWLETLERGLAELRTQLALEIKA